MSQIGCLYESPADDNDLDEEKDELDQSGDHVHYNIEESFVVMGGNWNEYPSIFDIQKNAVSMLFYRHGDCACQWYCWQRFIIFGYCLSQLQEFSEYLLLARYVHVHSLL